MKKQIFIAFVALIGLYSCDKDDELRIVNTSENANALLGFNASSYTIQVPVDTEDYGKTFDVQIDISNKSSEDRVFNIEVIDDLSDADESNYRVPSTVTVPAGTYNGTLTIEAQDETLMLNQPETIVLEISGANENTNIGVVRTTLTLELVCPVPEDYLVGDYEVINLTSALGIPDFTDGPVTIEREGEFGRVFENVVSPFNASSAAVPVRFNLVCNEIVVQPFRTNINLRCAAGQPFLVHGPSPNRATYDATIPGSDDSIQIIYSSNADGTCGTPPNNDAVVLLQKI